MTTKVKCSCCGSLVPMAMARLVEDKANRELSLEFGSESNDNIGLLTRIFPEGVSVHHEIRHEKNVVIIKPVLDAVPPANSSRTTDTPEERREKAIMFNIPGADKMNDAQITQALAVRAAEVAKGTRPREASAKAGASVAAK